MIDALLPQIMARPTLWVIRHHEKRAAMQTLLRGTPAIVVPFAEVPAGHKFEFVFCDPPRTEEEHATYGRVLASVEPAGLFLL